MSPYTYAPSYYRNAFRRFVDRFEKPLDYSLACAIGIGLAGVLAYCR